MSGFRTSSNDHPSFVRLSHLLLFNEGGRGELEDKVMCTDAHADLYYCTEHVLCCLLEGCLAGLLLEVCHGLRMMDGSTDGWVQPTTIAGGVLILIIGAPYQDNAVASCVGVVPQFRGGTFFNKLLVRMWRLDGGTDRQPSVSSCCALPRSPCVCPQQPSEKEQERQVDEKLLYRASIARLQPYRRSPTAASQPPWRPAVHQLAARDFKFNFISRRVPCHKRNLVRIIFHPSHGI